MTPSNEARGGQPWGMMEEVEAHLVLMLKQVIISSPGNTFLQALRDPLPGSMTV